MYFFGIIPISRIYLLYNHPSPANTKSQEHVLSSCSLADDFPPPRKFYLQSRQLLQSPLQLRHLSQLDVQLVLLILQLQTLVGIQLSKDVVALSVKLQDMCVVLPQTAAMADGHESDSYSLGVVVHDLFGLQSDTASALVENGVLGAVVEEPGHGDALLQTAGEGVAPLGFGIPAFRVHVDEVLELKELENGEEIRVGDASGSHLPQRVRVDNLLAERTTRQVWALREVENGVERRLVDRAAVDGPQATENAEERRLAAAVGAHDKQMVPLCQGEG